MRNYKLGYKIYFSSNYDSYGVTTAPTIVLLHPELGHRKYFKYQVDALSTKYRVIVIDLPNHGSRERELFKMEKAVDAVNY
jgi:pimeloyl-ACP methyl ester carboxylesterase